MTGQSGIAVALHRTASRSTRLLEPEAIARIGTFVSECQTSQGGFRGRGADADPYYTLFGLASLRALRRAVPGRSLARYLDRQRMDALDLVHLVSLLQSLRLLRPLGIPRRLRKAGKAALARFRSADGGYAQEADCAHATAYGTYLGLMGEEVLGEKPADPAAMAAAASRLMSAYLRKRQAAADLNGLAASAVVVQILCGPLDPDLVGDAIQACRGAQGAYRANADAAVPDLLSTAVAAFCLRCLGRPIRGGEARTTAEYVHALWHESGGFRAHAADERCDCEYTFYALLAMGALEP